MGKFLDFKTFFKFCILKLFMVNESILGGLRIAIVHNSSLKDAMQSFYNAGYDKNEIEEAAQIIFKEQQGQKAEEKTAETESNNTANKTQEAANTTSKQDQPSSKKMKLIILIVAALLVLVGGLIGVIIFKDKIF
jgi:F0F1-type ATP synthase assembly protein I